MTTELKPVAKSLHTLTVLQQVASMLVDLGAADAPAAALDLAMVRLGLAGRPDPYGLKARALKLLTA